MVATSSPQSEVSRPPSERTVFWAETIVRWTRTSATDIYSEPIETAEIVTQIHRGDMLQVRTDIKRGSWVPCRTGHITGWLNTQEVKLIRTGTGPLVDVVRIEPKPTQPAQPAPKPKEDPETRKRKTGLVQRLITFFK